MLFHLCAIPSHLSDHAIPRHCANFFLFGKNKPRRKKWTTQKKKKKRGGQPKPAMTAAVMLMLAVAAAAGPGVPGARAARHLSLSEPKLLLPIVSPQHPVRRRHWRLTGSTRMCNSMHARARRELEEGGWRDGVCHWMLLGALRVFVLCLLCFLCIFFLFTLRASLHCFVVQLVGSGDLCVYVCGCGCGCGWVCVWVGVCVGVCVCMYVCGCGWVCV